MTLWLEAFIAITTLRLIDHSTYTSYTKLHHPTGLASNCRSAQCLYTFAVLTRRYLPFHRKTPAKHSIAAPIAPIVLNTFGIPTAATQAGIAKTKIVLNKLRTTVNAVRASPMISSPHRQYEGL